MADFHPIEWAKEHPYATGAIVFGGGLVLLWALGYLGGGSSSANSGQTNMAAAYYAAEAAQATAGTQLNIAQTQADAAVKIQQIQGDSAVSINAANATASTTIAGSQYDAAKVIGLAGYQAQTAIAGYQAQTAQAQSKDALAAVQSTNAYNYATALSNNQASELINAMNNLVAPEAASQGGWADVQLPAGLGEFNLGPAFTTPNSMAQQGYTPAQIQSYFNGR